MNRKILVVAAHPDDEILGCGATIAKHTQAGDEVYVTILAEGLTSRDSCRVRKKYESDLISLQKHSRRANSVLGVSSVHFGDFPDNRMDSVDILDIVKSVETIIDQVKPEIIYSHHAGDVNIDHQYLHRAVVTATRPIPGRGVKTLLFFEVASSTEWQLPGSAPLFTPNWFVDVSDTIELKLAALREYQSEMRDWPHSRSVAAVEHLSRWRGATIGSNAAEAFMLGRQIIC